MIERIQPALCDGHRLIEPFTGSGAVFLNTDYEEYLLADTNSDLIDLFVILKEEELPFINYCRSFFRPDNNTAAVFYRFREEFNETGNKRRKAAIFLYLNRHCYNGLVRYNKQGKFNTPFGRYIRPYFPEKEMQQFLPAAKKATFIHLDYRECMQQARAGDVVYCDPPYTPLSDTAHFTDYHTGGFDWDDQLRLLNTSTELAARGVHVVISNHDTDKIRKLYKEAGARLERFQVKRSISCDPANRNPAGELIAVFAQ